MGLSIGHGDKMIVASGTVKKRRKQTQCGFGSTTHPSTPSKECKLNKNNVVTSFLNEYDKSDLKSLSIDLKFVLLSSVSIN